jgi:hypothetical protein
MGLGLINLSKQLATQKALDNNLHMVGIFIDLTKAYGVA